MCSCFSSNKGPVACGERSFFGRRNIVGQGDHWFVICVLPFVVFHLVPFFIDVIGVNMTKHGAIPTIVFDTIGVFVVLLPLWVYEAKERSFEIVIVDFNTCYETCSHSRRVTTNSEVRFSLSSSVKIVAQNYRRT